MDQQRKFFVLLALCANFAAQLSAQKLLQVSVAVSTKTLCRKTFPGEVRGTADPSASVGMTKERAALPSSDDCLARDRIHPILGGL
jgi:hypothetical protein